MGRHLGVFSCTMLMYPTPSIFPLLHFLAKTCPQHRSYHRHRYIFDTIDYPWLRRFCWRIPFTLGGRLFVLVLWALHLARIWHDVSSLWRGKGVPRSRISPSKVPCNRYIFRKCHHPWFYGEQLYRKAPFSNHYVSFVHVITIGLCPEVGINDLHKHNV